MELTPALREKKRLMIDGLRKTYKVQYDAVQPIPYIKDKLYCVDTVFVEGGVEVCLTPELTRETDGSWERLEYYKHIYTDSRLNSKRRIIQGEPGYGKSTLTLQLAYDWCNHVWNSSMRKVDILILLRLRQLGGIESIYRAIKIFLLAEEARLTVDDIKEIIQRCSSVNIILDGYDEYPDRDSNTNTDVHKMIVMKLFQNVDVTVTTRYLPKCLTKETKRAKLTGFDEQARDEYIRKAVVGDNDKAVEQIKRRLYENSVLADLCQVPLIFVMFAHMAHDLKHFITFTSVTQFFKYMIRCFHEHLRRKFSDTRNKDFNIHESEHQELDRIAFEGLNKKNQQLTWNKETFEERVGQAVYEQYILIGLLVEEQVVSRFSKGDDVLYTTEVRFYHKLFCEWYAAHHFVSFVMNTSYLEDALEFLDPFDLQYLFRFACGLHPDAGKKLIDYLKSRPGGDTFVIFCMLEQTGDINNIMDSVKDLCSRDVKIKRGDSALLQRSTKQMLEIASNNNIPISCLHLEYSGINFEGDTIILGRGISLPILPTVEKVAIVGNNETVTEKDILNLFNYGRQCRRIKQLMFNKLQLPTSFQHEALTDMKTRNIQVCWRPFDINFHLDLQIGHWEVDDLQVMENIRFSTVSIDGQNNELQQRSNVQLLHVAHRHNIPISYLLFKQSFKSADNATITLNNGIHVTSLPPIQKIHVVDKSDHNARELTERDVVNTLLCAMDYQHFNELCFEGWLMPISFSPSSFTNTMISRAINVSWCPFDKAFRLDLKTGHWEIDDIHVMENIRFCTVYIDKNDRELQRRSTIQLLHVAHNHNIPISSLLFKQSFKSADYATIILNNGIRLTNLPPLQKIHVVDKNDRNARELTKRDIVSTLLYAMEHQHFKELCFEGCLMPISFSPSSFTNTMISRSINVSWCPFDKTFRLDLKTGHWEVDDLQVMEHIRNSTVSIDGQNNKLQQRSNVQLLHVAHNHNIPISSLLFKQSFKLADNETIISNNGIHVTSLPPLQKIHFVDENNARELTERDIVNTLLYAMKHQHLNELCFEGWLMPISFSPSSFTSTTISLAINVSWCPFDKTFRLDLETGHWEVDNIAYLLQLCSDTIYINRKDNILKQRSTVQLIHIATTHQIPISRLCLEESYSEIDAGDVILNSWHITIFRRCLEESYSKIDAGHVIFNSGIRLSCPVSVRKVVIQTEEGREMTETEVVDILMFVKQSHMLEELQFKSCLMPHFFPPSSFKKTVISRKINVSWCPFDYVFHLDLRTGHWEVDNIDSLRQLCSDSIYINDSDDILEQRSTIQLIDIASIHDIPISCLYLKKIFSKINFGDVNLHSGLRLPCPASVKKVVIDAAKGGQMTATEVVDILMFVQQSHLLKELEFKGWLMPEFFSPLPFKKTMTSRKINVLWCLFDNVFHLDLITGRWEVHNVDSLRHMCSDTIFIDCRDNILRQMSTIHLIDIASIHNIPISCLYLNKSFSKIDAGTLILHSGLHLSSPASVKKVVIDTENDEREMTETEVVDILMFVQQSHLLEELDFEGWLMPDSFSPSSFTKTIVSRKFHVSWCPFDNVYILNLKTGHWEVDNIDSLRQLCSDTIYINGSNGKVVQRSTVLLIDIASIHDIPIASLHLNQSFSKIDAGSIILHSGLRLPRSASVKQLSIDTKFRREITETEFVDILKYVQQSDQLEELRLDYCVLPLSLSSDSIPAEMPCRNIKVLWRYFGYSLDLQSGAWKIDDLDRHTFICRHELIMSDSELLQRCMIKFLENASKYNIPINCLNLREHFMKCGENNIVLDSGHTLTYLSTLENLKIERKTHDPKSLSEEEIKAIFQYVLRSRSFKRLSVGGYLLPPIFPSDSIPTEMQFRDISVVWNDYGYCLNLQSGVWEVADEDTVRKLCAGTLEIHPNDSELLQRCTIKLLENASNYNIPISRLYLKESFSKIDAGDVILSSGLRMSCLVSVKEVVIHTERGREMTETEVVDILMFVQQSNMLEQLEFSYCVLPQSFPAESIPSILKSRNVTVTWRAPEACYYINLQSGRWTYRVNSRDITYTEYVNRVRKIRRKLRMTKGKSRF